MVSDNELMVLLLTIAPLVVTEFRKIPISPNKVLLSVRFAQAQDRLLIVFPLMTGLPLAVIPRTDVVALLEASEALRIMLELICPVPDKVLRIPLNCARPVAVLNVVPVFERLPPVTRFPILKFGRVLLPMVLLETV